MSKANKRVRPGAYKPPPYPRVVETFREIQLYLLDEWRRENEPSCFNCKVNVRKYRITIEEIDEPNDVIAARIKKLWRECDNMHHAQPIKATAAEYGVDLSNEQYGKDRKRSK